MPAFVSRQPSREVHARRSTLIASPRRIIDHPGMNADQLLVDRQDRVAYLTFNRPDARNAMTFEMYERLHDLVEELDRDDRVRVIVLRGAGDKAFVSGTDIRQFLTFETREHALEYERRISRVLRRIHTTTTPTIAMVQGDAVGGGLFMAIACDLRLAADHARFGAPVARTLGNAPAPFSVSLLAATIGPVRAREIMLTARLVDATEAKTIGLVDRVSSRAELPARVEELAAQLTQLAPLTLAAVKEATRRMIAPNALRDAEDIVLSCYLSQDFKEGVRAFLDKRTPDWQGR
jgi:enoyl-CoA hydratase/carnithine racemase